MDERFHGCARTPARRVVRCVTYVPFGAPITWFQNAASEPSNPLDIGAYALAEQ
jgi:hypothetical protein